MKEMTVNIEGMKCGGCAQTVEEKLKGVPGVQSVDISLENHSAKVSAEDDVTEAQLADSLKGTSYKALVER